MPLSVDIINRVDEIERKFSRKSHEPTGVFKLGSSTTIGSYVLPPLLDLFIKEFPEIELTMEVQNSDSIINRILDFDIDMGIIEGQCHHSSVEVIPWRKDRLAIFCSPDHPLAGKDEVTAHDLSKAKWILREPGSGSRAIFENALTGVISNIDVVLELGNTEAVKNAVEANIGISCLSIYTLERSIKRGDLIEIKSPFIDLSRFYYILIHKKKYKNQLLQSCMNFWNRYASVKEKLT